jgi:hypothetical protein
MRSEVLQHPNGTRVVLLGTQHVSATHGCLAREQIEAGTPTAVVLELDQVSIELPSIVALTTFVLCTSTRPACTRIGACKRQATTPVHAAVPLRTQARVQ